MMGSIAVGTFTLRDWTASSYLLVLLGLVLMPCLFALTLNRDRAESLGCCFKERQSCCVNLSDPLGCIIPCICPYGSTFLDSFR